MRRTRWLFDAVRQPEYTGENRCLACTIVNTALVIGLASHGFVLVGPWFGVSLAVLGGGAVWLRGYLVPGTPWLAPRLVALLPGSERLFATAHGDTPSTPDRSRSFEPADDRSRD